MPPKQHAKRADAARTAKREAQAQLADFSDSAVTAHAQMRDVRASDLERGQPRWRHRG